MTQELNEDRVLTSAIEYANLNDSPGQGVAGILFHKKLYADGLFLGVEEEIHVSIAEAGYTITRRRPRRQAGRPEQDTTIAPPVAVALSDAYANFQRTNAEILHILTAYVAPMY